MLLKYKLNNVCDADNRPANGAQITKQFLYATIYCGCQYVIVYTHYLRINCVLQAHRENNAHCVRIKSVLGKYASAHLQQSDGLMLPLTPVFVLPILVPSRHAATCRLLS